MRILKKILPIALILVLLVTPLIPAQPVLASTLYEYYNTGDSSDAEVYDNRWRAQTFTPSETHIITSVKLLIYRTGSPGTLTVSIKATSDDHPDGADLCSGTFDGDTLTTNTAGAWYEITLGAGYSLTAETKYAIVIRALDGNSTNKVHWRVGSDGYAGGCHETSTTSGSSWSSLATYDSMFEEWGESAVVVPTVTTQAASNVEETTATGHGTITDTGGENCSERGMDWDTDSGAPYAYGATDSGSFGTGAFTKGMTGLNPGTLYYYRAKAQNSAGWGYGSELTFLTKPTSPTTFVATPGNTQVSLSWIKGTGADYTIICGKIDSYPTDYDITIGKIGDVVDSLEFSDVDIMDLRTIHIGGTVYAIVYRRSSDNRGIICTISIDASGNIGDTVIDSLIFDTYGDFPAISHISGDVYVIVYSGPDGDGWMATIDIDSSGDIGAAPIDTWEFDVDYAQQPRIEHIFGTVYVVVYYGVPEGEMFTVSIANNGTITKSKIDTLTFDAVKGDEPYIINVSGIYYAVAYMGPDTDGWLKTVTIDNSGNIGDTPIDSLEYDTLESSTSMLVHINGNYYAICYRGDGADGWLATVTIDSSGNISDAVIDTLEFDTVRGNVPTISLITAGYYAISWGDITNVQMEVCTVPIDNVGVIGAIVDQDVLDSSGSQGYTSIFSVSGDIFVVAYQGPDDDGWVKSFSIEESNVDVYSGTDSSTIHTGLTNNDHWYYRAWSKTVAGGWTQYSDFYAQDDAIPSSDNPAVTTNTATSITISSAVLNGGLDNLGIYSPVYVFFQYGMTPSYGTNTSEQARTSTGSFNQEIAGLSSNQTYYFRAVVRYNSSYIYGANQMFQTSGIGAPAVTTGSAVNKTTSGATLQGTLTGLGDYSPVYVSFEYGLTTAYGTTTADQTKTATGGFSADISSLTANTTYHFRTRVRYNSSYTYGGDVSFVTTALGVPLVTTAAATEVTGSGAKLQGTLDSLGNYSPVYAYFEYGQTTAYGTTTAEQTKASTGGFYQTVGGLTPGTTYHFRAVVRYNSSHVYGSDRSFITPLAGEPGIDPPDILRIDDIKVFTNYFEDDDQLYVIAYRIVYTAGTPILDVTDYFDFQLLDGTVLKGQWPVKSWDYKPGSIYLCEASAPAWGGDYRIKIIGAPDKWETPPECYRDLTPGDWQGDVESGQLDTWVLSFAESLQNYYNTEMITYVTGGQSVLSPQGGVIFNMGIPGLSIVRPNLFSAKTGYSDIDLETDRSKAREEALKASSEERMGPYITGKLGAISDLLPGEIGVREVAGVGLGLIYLFLALTIGAMAGNMLWGLSATILVFGPGAYFGVVTPTLIAFIAFMSAVIFVYQVWWKPA